MIYIISGTDREGSRSLILAKQLLKFYQADKVEVEIIDLKTLKLNRLHGLSYNQDLIPEDLKILFKKIATVKALHIICPEYNGSYPGILKLFIDHWIFPDSLEEKLVAFVGLGGSFSGLRPVEHLMQVFSYRNAILYPQRVFLTNVWTLVKANVLVDKDSLDRLKKQASGFNNFIKLHK